MKIYTIVKQFCRNVNGDITATTPLAIEAVCSYANFDDAVRHIAKIKDEFCKYESTYVADKDEECCFLSIDIPNSVPDPEVPELTEDIVELYTVEASEL